MARERDTFGAHTTHGDFATMPARERDVREQARTRDSEAVPHIGTRPFFMARADFVTLSAHDEKRDTFGLRLRERGRTMRARTRGEASARERAKASDGATGADPCRWRHPPMRPTRRGP